MRRSRPALPTLLIAALLWLLPGVAAAQGEATLVADSLTVTADSRLVAAGNVEVLYDGTRLSAGAISYDRTGDRLTIEGPIFIQTSVGQIFTADRAELDPRLENGILRGARLVLDQQLQLAANRIDRVDGRYTQLYKTAATSCQICGDRAPLWDIRAERVIHDEVAQQLYFDNARFRIRGVPILWLPRMRLPDPTLTRATGLLIPEIRTTDLLGTGLKLPYFIRLGDSADLTLTPYLSPETRTLEARYRQAYLRGDLVVEGAITEDTVSEDSTRGYVFAEAGFDLGGGFRLGIDVQAVSDPTYLLDYGYGDTDRLDSSVELLRVRADDLFRAEVLRVESLRDGDDNDVLPTLLPRLSYERVVTPRIGGRLDLRVEAEAARRASHVDGAGRDTARIGASADYALSRVLPGGLLASAGARLDFDAYRIDEDSAYDGTLTRATPSLRAELRWPMAKTTQRGAVHLLEPVVQLAWSHGRGDPVPNEDSTVVELDEANLFALSRFPGEDRRETGLRGAIALAWTRIAPTGWETDLSFGRVYRSEAATAFPDASGLDTLRSDWLVTAGIHGPGGFNLDARGLFDADADFSKAEARLAWENARVALAATYVLLPRDAAEMRDDTVSEWTVDGSYRISDIWQVSADARYDIAADNLNRAGFGVEYRNECVTVDLSVSRRFTSSTTLQPTTDYGLSVALNGFSAGRSGAPVRRSCGD